MALSDGQLGFVSKDLESVNIQPLRGVNSCCLSLSLSPVKIIVSKRRSLGLYDLDDRLVFKSEISLTDTWTGLEYGSKTVCGADNSLYRIYDFKSATDLALFPYDKDAMEPCLTVISEQEYLLVTASAQGIGLGVFISSKGDPVRGTLQWPSVPQFLCFQFPYVVALLKNHSIQIHNIQTQSLVQTLTMPPHVQPIFMTLASYSLDLICVLEDGEKAPGGTIQIVFGSHKDIYGLRMIPWEIQVEQLFETNKFEQAIVLAEQMTTHDDSRMKVYYIKAVVGAIREVQFKKALEYLEKTEIDPLDLLSLYSLGFKHDIQSDHLRQLESIDQVIQEFVERNHASISESSLKTMKQSILKRALDMLEQFLELRHRETPAINNALIKLYCRHSDQRLLDFIVQEPEIDLDLVKDDLLSHEKYFCLSLLLQKTNLEKTLDLLKKIATGELQDPDFPGLDTVIDLLINTRDMKLVKKHCEWILRRNPVKGIQIFTQRSNFDPKQVWEYLEPFGLRAKRAFLLQVHVDHPEYRIELGRVLLQMIDRLLNTESKTNVTKLRTMQDPLSQSRLDFYDFVSGYQINTKQLLDLLQSTEHCAFMHLEHLVIYKKDSNHEKVLETLLKMDDLESCFLYCEEQPEQQKMFHLLLDLLIPLKRPAIVVQLLDRYWSFFDIHLVLSKLPDDWPFDLVAPFLKREVSRLFHCNFEMNLIKSLSKLERLKVS
ncbi:hypothetical protein EDD86DRAFT_193341 [Gorgonomyces haynaldii]|nr:hypothetical protein EDD86DRAFT_193341 [Gorgonomyces haynaldii]